MKKILYTDEPKDISTAETCGMIFALTILCLVLPIALYIFSMGA